MGAHNESEYLSDESDFYGDEAAKQDLENRAKCFSIAKWWDEKQMSLTEIADANVKSNVAAKAVTLYNPYEGQRCGRQLDESVGDFLRRLPPSTTPLITSVSASVGGIPWIYIANPYRKIPKGHPQYSKHELANEGPPDEDGDWPQFVVRGETILAELTSIKHDIERKRSNEAKGTITRAINVQKGAVVRKLLDTAVKLHCTSGKWMMFCETAEVDSIWAIIARATASNELGIAAKVAPRGYDDRQPRLVCIYTKDFTDMNDVARVISRMRDLGLASLKGRPIYYKCDAYTYLGLNFSNEYNIKASLYNSTDVLKAKDSNLNSQKLDSLLYKEEKVGDDWPQLE